MAAKTSTAGLLLRNQRPVLVFSLNKEETMSSRFGSWGTLASGAVISLALLTAGCAHRYYDPYYNDYHRWDAQENVYYQQWVAENHIDRHRDYRHLSKDEQKRYWDWRHSRDHDHDKDRDHDHR
jgi:hypothetical protein